MFATKIEDMKRDEGFTLIELLVVVIIIGILAAIAIPNFLSQRERGWQAELTSDVRNSGLEVEAEATALSGVYPATFTAPTFAGNTTITYATTATNDQFCLFGVSTNPLVGNVIYSSFLQGLQDFDPNAGPTGCDPVTGLPTP